MSVPSYEWTEPLPGCDGYQPRPDPDYVPPRDVWRDLKDRVIELERRRSLDLEACRERRKLRRRVLGLCVRCLWAVGLLLVGWLCC